jgi:hypothetical protein
MVPATSLRAGQAALEPTLYACARAAMAPDDDSKANLGARGALFKSQGP